MRKPLHRLYRLKRQAGFTLLETFIALAIGIFLLAGIALVMGVTRQNFNAQSGLGQLQDDQRMAINMLVVVLEHSGFFYNPQGRTVKAAFPASAPFVSAAQSITGTSASGSTFDTVSVRYIQSPINQSSSDAMEDCNGRANDSATTERPSTNTFTLNSAGELTCAVTVGATVGTPKALSSGISSFSVLYGVDTDSNKSVDQYLAASAMTSDNWLSVMSVQVTVGFTNPLDSSKPPIVITRVINLMNQA